MFIVILEKKGSNDKRYIGPYRTHKRAEGDAKAWDNYPWNAYVVMVTPQAHWMEEAQLAWAKPGSY